MASSGASGEAKVPGAASGARAANGAAGTSGGSGWSAEMLAKFAPPKDGWKCPTCLVHNTKDTPKCVCCEAPNPSPSGTRVRGPGNGAAANAPGGGVPPKASGGAAGAAQAGTGSGWSAEMLAKFAPPKDGWKCPTCLVHNTKDAPKCVCCEAPNPSKGGTPVSSGGAGSSGAGGGFKFGATGASGFKFGAPAGGAAKPALGGAGASAASGGFKFGGSALSSSSSSSGSGSQAKGGGTGFRFGATTTAGAASSARASGGGGGGFRFGGAAPATGGAGGAGAGAGSGAAAAPGSAGAGAGAGSGGARGDDGASSDGDAASPGDPASYFDRAGGADAPFPAPDLRGVRPELCEIYRCVALAAADGASAAAGSRASPGGGEVYTHGSGECEQLGRGDDAEPIEEYPTLVPGLSGLDVCRVSAGGLHTAAVTTGGELYTWGCNDDGVLGREGPENLPALVAFEGSDGDGSGDGDAGVSVRVVAVDAGDSYMAVATDRGDVYSWGAYKGRDGNMGYTVETMMQRKPALVRDVRRYGRVVSVACGSNHTLALTETGTVAAWGYGEQGQLGRRVTERELRGRRGFAPSLTPYLVHIGGKGRRALPAAGVFCGGYHSFVTTRSGEVYATGLNQYGQLGLGDMETRFSPTRVAALAGKDVFQLAGGMHHSAALTKDGRLYTFGRGDAGQLGLSDNREDKPPAGACVRIPLQIPPARFDGVGVRQVSAGSAHTMALTCAGSLYAWGFGECSVLGNGLEVDEAVPCRIEGEGGKALAAIGDRAVMQVAAGGQHAAVLAHPRGTPICVDPATVGVAPSRKPVAVKRARGASKAGGSGKGSVGAGAGAGAGADGGGKSKRGRR